MDKRGPYRAEHLSNAQKKEAEGKLLVAGALAEPVDGAVFIFKNMNKDVSPLDLSVVAYRPVKEPC